MGKYIYGIDFGTSNSVLAVLESEKREIVHVVSDPSLLYFQDSTGCAIGKTAIYDYLSNNMKGRLLKSLKTLLPQSAFTFTYIYGKKYTAEDLVCLILKYLKDKADAWCGEDVKEVVLGRPVVFSEDPAKDALAEKRLRTAAQKAGFEKIWFQYEPIAAGFVYEQQLDKSEKVLIGDFGGGTSDFTIMELSKDRAFRRNRKCDILATGGVHIGGDDFDAAIMWNKLTRYFGYGLTYNSAGKMLELPVHIFRSLCEWEQMAFLKEGSLRKKLDQYYLFTNKSAEVKKLMQLIDFNLGFSLFQVIEKAKITLSNLEEACIDFQSDYFQIIEKVKTVEFNNFTKKEIAQVSGYLDKIMDQHHFSPEQIDKVFLTGGTSSIPEIKNIFTGRFGSNKMAAGDNFNSVAQGLALNYLHLSELS